MRLEPLASDSLGARSMCCLVETQDLKILIDPSVALAPRRFGLPPHSLEIKRMNEDWERILDSSREADVLCITHYHYDHYHFEPKQFEGKILLLKDAEKKINWSQRKRAWRFLPSVKKVARRVEFADGRSFKFGKTTLEFSQAVWHGPEESKLGYVVMLCVESRGEKFVFASDVEGPLVEETTRWILEQNPTLLYLSGPLTYMLGFRLSEEELKLAEKNFRKILEESSVETILLDHHLLRDLDYRKNFSLAYEEAKNFGKKVLTVAEFLGKPIEQLEARRKELYKKYPKFEIKPKKFFGE